MNQRDYRWCHTTTTPITEILLQNITCAVDIGIYPMTTSTAIETTSFTIRLLANPTSRTSLGSVLLGDRHGFGANSFRLVSDEVRDFAEVPRVQLLIVAFTVIDTVADSAQIANDDSINLLIFAPLDEVLTDDVKTVIDLSGLFTLNLLIASRRDAVLFVWWFDVLSNFLPVSLSGLHLPSTDNHRISFGGNCGHDVIESKIDGDYVGKEGGLDSRDIDFADQMGIVVPSNSIVGQLDSLSGCRVNAFAEEDWEGKILDAVFSFRSAREAKVETSISFDDSKSGLDIGDWRKRMFWTESRRHSINMPIVSQREERFVTVDDLLDNVLRRLRMEILSPVIGFVLCLQVDSIQVGLWRFWVKRIINIITVISHLLPALVGLAKIIENCIIDLGSRKTEVIQNLLCFGICLNLGFVCQVHFFFGFQRIVSAHRVRLHQQSLKNNFATRIFPSRVVLSVLDEQQTAFVPKQISRN